jgi:pimeloyl-ACP methyl ester carboxylesterase
VRKPEQLDVDVAGGSLRVQVWRPEAEPTLPPILGLHGVTASSMLLQPLASRLAGEALVVAPDLRGRGGSFELPAPYGMAAHADDCAAVVRAMHLEPAIVVGVSMGGFVSAVFAARYPELVRSVVLVDGGPPLPAPEGIPIDVLIQAVLGPAVERLTRTFESLDAYFDYWRSHPAVGEEWSTDVEDYLRYDLMGEEPQLRSRVSLEAVTADTEDQLIHPNQIGDAMSALTCPVHMIRAERGLLNTEALYPDALVAPWREKLPRFTDELVEDTNHYTLVLGERGANRTAEVVRSMA